MKRIITSVFVVLSALTACTVQNQGQSYDEVYYNPNDRTTIAQNGSPVLRKSTKEIVVRADTTIANNSYIGNNGSNAQGYKALADSGAYVINNNFNYDDYYDYSYASRIRRFQNSPFNDYYHDYYTNRYWYDYNPGYWGSSIYSNIDMYYGMSPFSFSYGMYSPFNFGYSSFGNGYNSFGLGYYGLGFGGYGYGGYGGYYGGGYSYSNSYDQNSRAVSAPRRNVSGSNGPTPGERTTFGQRYTAFSNGSNGLTNVNAVRNGRETMNGTTAGGSANSGLKDSRVSTSNIAGGNQREVGNGSNNLFSSSSNYPNPQRVVNNRPILNRNDLNRFVSDPQSNQQTPTRKADPRSVQPQPSSYYSRERGMINNGNSRYVKPQQGTAAPQQYYTPANSRPRSSNEYTSPGYRNPAVYNSNQPTPQRSYSNPQRFAPPRSYQAPSSGSGSRVVGSYNNNQSSTPATRSSYSAPTQTYSAPTQTYSAPSQSTYSAPSQSYSAPSGNSRESGSSSSGSSSGSSSQGPRR